MGKTVLIHIPTAREWLLNRMRRRNPRRQEAAQSRISLKENKRRYRSSAKASGHPYPEILPGPA